MFAPKTFYLALILTRSAGIKARLYSLCPVHVWNDSKSVEWTNLQMEQFNECLNTEMYFVLAKPMKFIKRS